MSRSYLTVAGETEVRTEIKRSEFIATIAHVEDGESAEAFVKAVRKRFTDATHNCYAYISDERGNETRFSDDGEPGGTAVKAAIPGYQVAGKTGTARKYIPGHGYASGKYFSSFVGFVPARDPALVMLVTMDEPKGAYYASTVAAPTFKATCTRVLRHLNIQPDPVPETGSSTGQKP